MDFQVYLGSRGHSWENLPQRALENQRTPLEMPRIWYNTGRWPKESYTSCEGEGV